MRKPPKSRYAITVVVPAFIFSTKAHLDRLYPSNPFPVGYNFSDRYELGVNLILGKKFDFQNSRRIPAPRQQQSLF